jgi:uncharacterized protein YqeY
MSIRERVETDLRQALKAKDARRLSCLRMLKSRFVEREVELRVERGPDCRLNDDEAQAVIASYAKQRRESIESYRRGGRADLAREEEAELEIVAAYLPAQLGEAELARLVEAAIAETGASGPQDLGRVMKAVLARAGRAADGRVVQQLVRDRLGAG